MGIQMIGRLGLYPVLVLFTLEKGLMAEEYLIEKITEKLGYEPTICQQELVASLARFTIEYETCDLLLVSGYAGTGKTSAIAVL